MKEETNETAHTSQPSEAEMNGMYQEAWLNFHADAQEAQQNLNRRYAKMVDTFGSYKQMPGGVKEILKQDYAAHKAKWGENGEEQQKRFGTKESEPVQLTGTFEKQTTPEQAGKRQEFLQKMQDQRQQQPKRSMEYEL